MVRGRLVLLGTGHLHGVSHRSTFASWRCLTSASTSLICADPVSMGYSPLLMQFRYSPCPLLSTSWLITRSGKLQDVVQSRMRRYRNLMSEAAMTPFARACRLRGIGLSFCRSTLATSSLDPAAPPPQTLGCYHLHLRSQRPMEAAILLVADCVLILTGCVGICMRCNHWCT